MIAEAPAVTMPNRLLTYVEAAAELRISVRELRRQVSAGLVRVVRLGHRTVRFRQVEIEKFKLRNEK